MVALPPVLSSGTVTSPHPIHSNVTPSAMIAIMVLPLRATSITNALKNVSACTETVCTPSAILSALYYLILVLG